MAVQTTYPENMPIGFAGQIVKNDSTIALTNGEASAELAFGQAINWGSTDGTVLSPDNLADVICGLVGHRHGYADAELGTTGVKPGAVIEVVRKGQMVVKCENGCTVGQRLYVRIAGGTEGALRSAADGVNTIDSTGQGVWLSAAAADGLALLEFDFTNKPA